MWLKEKKYTISVTDQDSVLTKEDLIKVKLNGIQTTIELSQLFAKIGEIEIKDKFLVIEGWSILQNIVNGKLIIGKYIPGIESEGVDISFETESGIQLEITSIKNPIVQWNDIELTEEEVKSINDKLLELSVDSSEQETEVVEEPHSLSPVFVNEAYEKGKLNLLKKGYVEYEEGNFRFLLVKDTDKCTFIELLSETQLNQLQNGEKVVDNFYRFKDENNNTIINCKLIGDELLVERELIDASKVGEIETTKEENEVEL